MSPKSLNVYLRESYIGWLECTIQGEKSISRLKNPLFEFYDHFPSPTITFTVKDRLIGAVDCLRITLIRAEVLKLNRSISIETGVSLYWKYFHFTSIKITLPSNRSRSVGIVQLLFRAHPVHAENRFPKCYSRSAVSAFFAFRRLLAGNERRKHSAR